MRSLNAHVGQEDGGKREYRRTKVKLSRRDFLKLLGIAPTIPAMTNIFPNVSPSPTDIQVNKPIEKKQDTYSPRRVRGTSASITFFLSTDGSGAVCPRLFPRGEQ